MLIVLLLWSPSAVGGLFDVAAFVASLHFVAGLVLLLWSPSLMLLLVVFLMLLLLLPPFIELPVLWLLCGLTLLFVQLPLLLQSCCITFALVGCAKLLPLGRGWQELGGWTGLLGVRHIHALWLLSI